MKNCIKCKLFLDESEFHKQGKYLKSICRTCCSLLYFANREKLNEYQKERYKLKQQSLIQYQRNWRSKNKHIKSEESARERARRKLATPLWLTKEHILQMRELYKESINLSILTGIKHHVDHIIPLNSKLVCGLHFVLSYFNLH